jgi:hypothetical protein
MKECRGLQAQGFECNFEGAAVGGSSCGDDPTVTNGSLNVAGCRSACGDRSWPRRRQHPAVLRLARGALSATGPQESVARSLLARGHVMSGPR